MKPITTYKTIIAIYMVFLITVSLAACLGGNEDDTEGVESTTTSGTTTPTTEQSSGSINPEFVGYWGASIPQTNGDIYYDFRTDGTFKELRVGYTVTNTLGHRYPQVILLTCGEWYESGGSIYMTNRVCSDWDATGGYGISDPNGGYLELEQITPKNQSAWRNASDFEIRDITLYPEGIPTITSDRVFKPSEWEGKIDSEDSPTPTFHFREVMPPGAIENAFVYINP